MPKVSQMARLDRASLLLPLALGVALSMPPSIAAAANGGATPASGAAAASAGGAAPDAAPVSSASSTRTGGAAPGHRPARRVVRHPAKAKPKPTARRPVRRARTRAPSAPTVAGVFPVGGSFTFGGSDARFGAKRNGHVHQGQDVVAAEGTPLRAPVSGTVVWTGDQKGGAGIYLVIHGTDGRDYVLMHLKERTLVVADGDAVRAGQQVGEVGATGDASGPHLHFEIWVGGWATKTGRPIDPLPQLRRWAAGPA